MNTSNHPHADVHQPSASRLYKLGSLAVGLLASFALHAQDLPFNSGSNGSDGALNVPTGISLRWELASAYDAGRDEIVVFGGSSASNVYLGDTWTFDGQTWSPRLSPNSPSVRRAHAMAYDVARDEVVLFGGYNGTARLGDTWVWDGTQWTQKSPAGATPTPRQDAAMAYDEVNQEIVLFGGSTGSTQGDTWTWNGTNWSLKSPATSPSIRYGSAMAWNGQNNRILLFGGHSAKNDTWEWDGTNWTLVSSAINPPGRDDHGMAYDPNADRVYMMGAKNNQTYTSLWEYDTNSGWSELFPDFLPFDDVTESIYGHQIVYFGNPSVQKVLLIGGYRQDFNTYQDWTLALDGGDWKHLNGSSYYFDMSSKPSGVYNFTTVNVPNGVTVRFVRNASNTPAVWLASGDVTIDGTINLNGQTGFKTTLARDAALAGPGGYDGGVGGIAFNNSTSYAGTDGQGPGGGTAGTSPFDNATDGGSAGTYFNTYGNNFIVPLIGGSGGGGTSSTDTENGAGGGAGGGAILIASSADITLNGRINAKGGNYIYETAPTIDDYSGRGSGGAVKLVADRVGGQGIIDVRGGNNDINLYGRIRLEGYETGLSGSSHFGAPSVSAPVTDNYAAFLTTQPTLSITQVDGVGVSQPPSGDTGNPDVIFSSGGSVNIVVTGTNIPDGTPITVDIAFPGGTTTLPSTGQVTMQSGSATISGTIPSGVGIMEAYAQFISN